jgi:hypothetical protein
LFATVLVVEELLQQELPVRAVSEALWVQREEEVLSAL